LLPRKSKFLIVKREVLDKGTEHETNIITVQPQ
jgi:hypothetical protein